MRGWMESGRVPGGWEAAVAAAAIQGCVAIARRLYGCCTAGKRQSSRSARRLKVEISLIGVQPEPAEP